MLFWVSKFGTAKTECSFKIGSKTFGGTIYFAVDCT